MNSLFRWQKGFYNLICDICLNGILCNNKMKPFIESDLEDPRRLAQLLTEHNKWRRGIGKYKWQVNPAKNADMPLHPSQLTMVLNATVEMLRKLSRSQKMPIRN